MGYRSLGGEDGHMAPLFFHPSTHLFFKKWTGTSTWNLALRGCFVQQFSSVVSILEHQRPANLWHIGRLTPNSKQEEALRNCYTSLTCKEVLDLIASEINNLLQNIHRTVSNNLRPSQKTHPFQHRGVEASDGNFFSHSKNDVRIWFQARPSQEIYPFFLGSAYQWAFID